tara:strand:+ start:1415 stop:2479 length:1065 start_codon:yes stop_codon:yes gene_type:complete
MAAFTTIDDAGLFFNTLLWTGTGSSHAITGVGFTPDMTWIKKRDGTTNHQVQDTVRSALTQGFTLYPNESDAQQEHGASITSWDADGFTLGTDGPVNGSSDTFAGWSWKAGTTTGIATNGSTTITPSSYSFNQTSRFSVLYYTGNATSGAGLAHGLGVTPTMVIFKNLQTTESWMVYQQYLQTPPENYAMQLNTTGQAASNSTNFNNTAPDSVNMILGNGAGTNSVNTFIAYCFADIQGYSKFGGYTGNGNADGPFIYTGFKPACIIIKISIGSGTGNWHIFDNKRLGYNVDNNFLYPNLTNAEDATDVIDLTSNGFKIRATEFGINADAKSLIYAAWAKSPFVNSEGVPNNAR